MTAKAIFSPFRILTCRTNKLLRENFGSQENVLGIEIGTGTGTAHKGTVFLGNCGPLELWHKGTVVLGNCGP